jgi:hypothetical protein
MGYIPRVGDISVEVHSKTKDPFWMIARRDKDVSGTSSVWRSPSPMSSVIPTIWYRWERSGIQRIGETSGKCPECSTVFALKPARLP